MINEFSDKIFNLMVEPMARNLHVYQKPCSTYTDLIQYTKLLKGKHDFTAVSLDTLTLFHSVSMEHTCRLQGIEHPGGQNDFGKSWSLVEKDFLKAVMPLTQLPIGCFFHAHET
ncbi:MAG: hypothetical protein HC773_01370 [Scytonema sp. CRU_2_7]|nr:hypothetical protein [Scytonema sp. CRU_2_7]